MIFILLSSENCVDVAAEHGFVHCTDARCKDIPVRVNKGRLRDRRNTVGFGSAEAGVKIHREGIPFLRNKFFVPSTVSRLPSVRFTIMKTTLSPYSRQSLSKSGSSRLHGGHHVAQKFMTTGLPNISDSLTVFPSASSTGKSGAVFLFGSSVSGGAVSGATVPGEAVVGGTVAGGGVVTGGAVSGEVFPGVVFSGGAVFFGVVSGGAAAVVSCGTGG